MHAPPVTRGSIRPIPPIDAQRDAGLAYIASQAGVGWQAKGTTRSVTDFAQMMAFFDRHGVALVSVTQHLNSGDSLGRLAINTLMSFAEFERDIAGERTRDKLIATRRKGLWIGSVPPLGYVLQG